jgi:hypothetical protein
MRTRWKVVIGVGASLAVAAGGFVRARTRNTCERTWLDEFNRSPALRSRFGHITWCLKVEEFTGVPGSRPAGGPTRWRFRWGTWTHDGSGRRYDSTRAPPSSQLWMDGEWFEKEGGVFIPGPPGPEWP